MGKIFFNLKEKKFNYLEENEVTQYDLAMNDIARKIVLVSMNDIKTFPALDVSRKNAEAIQNFLKNGFSPMNNDIADMIAEQYQFCPHCGEDIDINQKTSVVIWDSSITLKNVAKENLYVAKPITCEKCGHEHHFYYDIYASDEEIKKYMISTAKEGSAIYLKLRYIINTDKMSYIPMTFYMKQFKAFFDENEKKEKSPFVESNNKPKSDIKKTLGEKDDRDILRMLLNERAQEALETPDNKIKNNLKLEFNEVKIGAYKNYSTKKDFELIQMYESIGNDTEKLMELVLS